MYSFKEKQKHYAELRNPDAAEQDLEFLRKKQPGLSTLSMFSRNPKRYADDILYALLDVAERDEIRNNRRTVEQTPYPNPEQPDKMSEVTNQVEEAEERTEEAELHTEEVEERVQEAEKRAEEAELRAEEAEERAESAEAALEEEKKSRYYTKNGKVQKHEEYPKIDWDNLSDPQVQTATILYNDRIVSWKQMKQLDEQLDKNPTERAVTDMAELRIRNLLAFEELQSFNDTGKFRYKHPLIIRQSERAQLEELLRKNPQEFLRYHKNVLDNIRRYESYLKRADRESQRAKDRENLRRHREREAIFKVILESTTNKN